MAVTYVDSISANSGSATATSFTTSWPAGYTPVADDYALIFGHVSAATLTMSISAGWSSVDGITNPVDQGSNSRMYAWRRRLQVGDSAPTITNSGSVTGGWEMLIFRGAHLTDAIGQTGSATGSAVGSINIASLTGVQAASMLAVDAHCRVASGTIPTGWTADADYTERIDHATNRTTASANQRMTAATRAITADGNYGGDTFTVAGNTGSIIAFHIEVLAEPIAGAATMGAVGTATMVPRIQTRGAAALAAAGTAAAVSRIQTRAAAQLDAAGTVSAAGRIAVRATGDPMAAAGTADLAPAMVVHGAAVLDAVGTLTGSGTVETPGTITGDAVLAAAAGATLVPVIVARSAGQLGAAGAAAVSPRLIIRATATLAAVATLTGTVSAGAAIRRTAAATDRREIVGAGRRTATATSRRG